MPNKNEYTPTQYIAGKISRDYLNYSNQRRGFERKWYENNFFDDGYHFKHISRQTGRIIDQSELTTEMRSIPKASRQIRGIANLLSSLEPIPVVYPESVSKATFPDEQSYIAANQMAKSYAQKAGHWLSNEFKNQELKEKMIQMLILSAKHYISFLQVWPDAVDEKINSAVYDAFDIYLSANLTSIYDSPSIIKATPEQIARIQANELFIESARERLTPDNKYASSEVKQAYLSTRFNSGQESDGAATLILKEAFCKEYLNDDNWQEAKMLSEKTGAMDGKSKGDPIIRHAFEAGTEKLLDEYIDLNEYPFVDFRYEPGPIYGTPLIERFIPANKSLDIAMSRVERWLNTMVVGTWVSRDGEDLQVSNFPGGQQLTYKTTAPFQGQIAPLPGTVFNFISLLEKVIEEQGASTSALNQLPSGVKSGVAIEQVKASEYDNLKISTDMYKQTTRRVAERMLDIGDKYFLNPQTVYHMDNGEPQYFDIMGERGLKFRKENNIPYGDVVPIKSDSHVNIEVESGLGFTTEGKKQTMQQIINFMTNLAKEGLLTTDAVAMVVKKAMEVYQFGSTQEFMEAMDSGMQTLPINQEQIMQMKIAMMEAMKDAGVVGKEKDQQLIDSTKVGMTEVLKDLATGGAPSGQPTV